MSRISPSSILSNILLRLGKSSRPYLSPLYTLLRHFLVIAKSFPSFSGRRPCLLGLLLGFISFFSLVFSFSIACISFFSPWYSLA
jgi:hypothetical protein